MYDNTCLEEIHVITATMYSHVYDIYVHMHIYILYT